MDCLDALASDRQYRKAVDIDEAIEMIVADSGKAFDPTVVAIAAQVCGVRANGDCERYRGAGVSERRGGGGARPDAGNGFELSKKRDADPNDFLASIASARYEAHTLFELTQDLGHSLRLDETLSLVAMRLRNLVPYDSIVVFIRKEALLVPDVGQAQRVLIAMAILHHPALLIADEPTSALDAVTQSEILQLFSHLNKELGTSILYISHDLLSVSTISHRVAVMTAGRIVECSSTAQLFSHPRHPSSKELIRSIPVLRSFAEQSWTAPCEEVGELQASMSPQLN